MGKDLLAEHTDDQFEDNHPGCMGGVLHALDYHHWHYNVKKMFPHRKHDGRRHAKRNGSPNTRLNVHASGEVQKVLDAEASHFFVDQSTTKTSSNKKRSLKARIKGLISEEMSKEENHKLRGSGFPARSRLRRTYSIHHLEPSDHGLGEICTDWKHPISFLHNNADTGATRLQDPTQMKATDKSVACNEKSDACSTTDVLDFVEHNQLAENHTLFPEKCDKARESLVNQKLIQVNQHSRNASQFKEYLDVLEIFMVNKELFLQNLQHTDDGIADCFHSPQASGTKARLTKSGSFPVADLLRSRNFRSSELKHKQNEIWYFPKGEKLLAGTQAPKLVGSKFLKNLCTMSGPLMADDSGGSMLNPKTSFVSLGSTHELDKQGNDKDLLPLKDMKQRIEVAVKEGKNESSCASLDALPGRVPNGDGPFRCEKEMAERWTDSTMGGDGKDSSSNCHEIDGSLYDLSKGAATNRRTSSLNGSLDRYARLFRYSFSSVAKGHLSKSLKLTNEYEIPSDRRAPITFRRVRSLPHLDSSLHNEVSCDAHYLGIPIRTVMESYRNIDSDSLDEPKPAGLPTSTEMYIPLDTNEETECLNNMVETSGSSPRMEYLASLTVDINDEGTAQMDGLSEKMDKLTTLGESDIHNEWEITFTEIASNKLQPSPVLVLESCSHGVTSPPKIPISEGLESGCNYFDEKESSLNSQNESGIGFLSWSCSSVDPENFEKANKIVKNHMHIGSYTKDDADLNYVREILERSGFIGNGISGSWLLSDQPLNPSVFEEVEVYWPHEPQCSGEDICACCHHQLLFDLVNEVLLQIYDRSVTYYPQALSSTCCICPMPVGYNVLKEVWASISRSLNLRLDPDQPLDCVVAQDLAKDDGWMNLQLETECVALELEDLIFEELLEEIIHS